MDARPWRIVVANDRRTRPQARPDLGCIGARHRGSRPGAGIGRFRNQRAAQRVAATESRRYYWVDLEGLRVQTVDGIALGTVSHLLDTGANHVLVVQGDRERLIPFAQPQYVTEVDFDTGRIVVDWDVDF
jgi:sporulation protein YlmC with PRC-barrel domain